MEYIKIFIAGDFCPIGRNEINFINEDFSAVEAIRATIDEADFAIVNLEAPLTASNKKIKKSGPNIKASPKSANALSFLNIDLVTLANNHILDAGSHGVLDTINICKENNIETVGAGCTIDEARLPHFTVINGKNVVFMNFAENEFCAATENTAGANPINDITNFYDIQKAKLENDFVIVIVHGGREHYQLPTPKQRERFRFYADAGADLVVGHHTHCFSGYEMYKSKPIFYSLGNFIFDYKKKYQRGKWTEGYAVMFSLAEQISFEIIPFKQGRAENPNLTLLKADEEKIFSDQLMKLNTIIADDELFNSEWQKYLASQELNYTSMLSVHNKYVRAGINKKIIPYVSLHDSEHLLLLFNLMRCETHREITTEILSKRFDHER